ncbi:MAG: glycerol-3-phosphate dehydrogenase, partial [Micavibrio aeruginosavorus]
MSQKNNQVYDLCIIGGGINGTGIARDAAGRGLKVLLLEKDDLASHTSSASTKLIHGGLRYLEYYEFRLVHEALQEREVLLKIAPHIIWPMNFILPDAYSIRPFWMIRCGLYLYDILSFKWGKLKFPLSRAFNLRKHVFGGPLKNDFFLGVLYSDGWVQDSRLVVLNAMDARGHGADIRTGTKCTALKPLQKGWEVEIDGQETVQANIVVNAAGPWVHDLLHKSLLTRAGTPDVRLVQGSHIVVKKIHDGTQAYMLQQPDKRIVFAIPYENDFTLIGTTDTDYKGDAASPVITDAEIEYLLTAANTYFRKQISADDIVWAYSGVRPLLDDESGDAKSVTRDYKIHEDVFDGSHIVSVFGGKITTYRRLAETVMTKICELRNMPDHKWTATKTLPGGDVPHGDFDAFLKEQRIRWENENINILRRYARNYGTKMIDILSVPKGTHYGDGVYEAEIRYLVDHEFAKTAEDILWRRSKLGLHISDQTKANIEVAVE